MKEQSQITWRLEEEMRKYQPMFNHEASSHKRCHDQKGTGNHLILDFFYQVLRFYLTDLKHFGKDGLFPVIKKKKQITLKILDNLL